MRHYHEVGLLPEPERRSNGYKQYGVAHLVRLLRIRRLTDLGFSLPQIAEMGDADEHPGDALRALDAELAATIERLQRARLELGVILRQAAPTDLPPEIAPVTAHARLTAADRSLVVVMTRILGPAGLETYREVLREEDSDPATSDFDHLPDDADEPTRAALAERLTPVVRSLRDRHPGLADIGADAPGGPEFAARTMGVAIRDLYNSAQLDVLRRVHLRLQAPV